MLFSCRDKWHFLSYWNLSQQRNIFQKSQMNHISQNAFAKEFIIFKIEPSMKVASHPKTIYLRNPLISFTHVDFNKSIIWTKKFVQDSFRFVLEFYSSVKIIRDKDLNIFVKFWALNEVFIYSLIEFANILNIPYEGQCAYSEECSLTSLEANQETIGPYKTSLPSLNQIINTIQKSRTLFDQHSLPSKVHKSDLCVKLQPWNEIIRQNILCFGEECVHIPASSCHMMYCIITNQAYNLAYFFINRMINVRPNSSSPMPYGMLLSCLFEYITIIHSRLYNSKYISFPRSMSLMGDVDDFFESESECSDMDESTGST